MGEEGKSSSAKKRRRGEWISIDAKGRAVTVRVDKYTIMNWTRINPRDLRIIDPDFGYPSAILCRDKAIVLNLEHIKAIIMPDKVLLRNPLSGDIVPIVEELRRQLDNAEQNDYPFEFRVLEVAMEAICSHLAARTTELENDIYPALDLLTSKITSRNLDYVRKLKSQMTRLIARVHKVQDELEKLLDEQDDMWSSYFLSRKQATEPSITATASSEMSKPCSLPRGDYDDIKSGDVTELEMSLEAYYSQIEGTFEKLSMLREYVQNTEDFLNIQLDNLRNQLIKLDLLLNSANFSLGIYALITSIFGISIPYEWNNGYGGLFKWVNIVGGALAIGIYAVIYCYARRKGIIVS